jgi:hypothetical protein
MKEILPPIEVQLVLRDMKHLDTRELLDQLQEVVDEWWWKQVPTIPCGVVKKN